MIFNGKHSFKLTPNVNLIVGKNKSGKSIVSIDSFKYVFLKHIRYKKIENVLNSKVEKDDHGYIGIKCEIENIDMEFKRYLLHSKYKNNLCIASDTESVFVSDKDNFANVKNIPIQSYLKNLNVHLDHFELVNVYNPSKNIMAEKKAILDLLSVNFNNIIAMFNTIYSSFEGSVDYIKNEVSSLERQLNELTKGHSSTIEVEKLESENKDIKSRIIEYKEKKSVLSETLSKLNSSVGNYNSNISTNNSAIEKLVRFYKSGVCNMCGRPFDDEEQKSKLVSDIKSKKKEVEDCSEKLKLLKEKISKIKDAVSKLDTYIWKLADRGKENEKKMVNNDSKIETIRTLLNDKKKSLEKIEEQVHTFKRTYDKIFSPEEINAYIRKQMQSFEQTYQEIYNIITQQSVTVKLNLNKYEEPEFGEFFHSGLSTSEKRITYLSMMLALHIFCDVKLNFLILDEYFDVFDFDNMVKTLETIFSNAYFKNLQCIITSNNEDLIGLVKNNPINLINLIDYTKN